MKNIDKFSFSSRIDSNKNRWFRFNLNLKELQKLKKKPLLSHLFSMYTLKPLLDDGFKKLCLLFPQSSGVFTEDEAERF